MTTAWLVVLGWPEKVKTIHQSAPFGIPPVVVNPNLRPQIKADLQAILLEMVNDPAGQDALAAIGVEKFVTFVPSTRQENWFLLDVLHRQNGF
jgi:phosphonate transport system substrate-binding protein